MNNPIPLRPVDSAIEEQFRSPPQNLEAEQALLGAILSNNEAADRVSNFLTADHFSEGVHARIFEAATTLIRMGKLASPVTLKSHFENDATLKEIGGSAYLGRLAASATTIINAEEYGRTIYELAQRRKLISIGTEVVNEAFEPDIESSAKDMIERAEQALYGLAETDK
jgi:replicative DNA helicase